MTTASFLRLPKVGAVFVLRFQTEHPTQERKFKRRGAVRKNFVLFCLPDVVPALLHFDHVCTPFTPRSPSASQRAHRCAFLLGTDLSIRCHGKVVSGGIPSAGYSVVMWREKIPLCGRAREGAFYTPHAHFFFHMYRESSFEFREADYICPHPVFHTFSQFDNSAYKSPSNW